MDYNKEDKGVVCFMNKTCNKRTVYFAFAFIIALLWGFLALSYNFEQSEFSYLMIGFGVITISALFISINPHIFLLKLVGFLASLAGILIALHNINELKSITENSIFSTYFIIISACGFVILFTLLSWFVYNARSSEVNQI
ncbi:putative membrane protein [Campylobacter pinnipediorum subsp. caledonicus]|uniref:hypothetical protein n=1 Tax=Campylobacter pinnipediorum TaxID=1965231 RepID=UPI00099591D6|nr:hypothetical protein [Campylobacter pinnipediorum]AQW86713.1 putative membrane protein [Campylobacter pinnipediorum subsp. caledonicus]